MPKKILIVDDSAVVAMAASMLLQNYEVLVAKDGQAGLETAIRTQPDLILLDFVMPKMDGLEVCQRLRAHPSTQNVPILMLTTRGEPRNIEAGFEAGCTEYLTKPFDGSELLARIRAFIGE